MHAVRPSRAAAPIALACLLAALLGACGAAPHRASYVTTPPAPSSAAASPSASVAAVEPRSPGCGQAPPTRAGGDATVRVSLDPAEEDGASTRTAVVHVPASYVDSVAAPLVLEFHGAAPTATAAGYESSSPLHALSDSHGFLDVFPQGLRAPNGNLAWNAYGPVYWRVAEIPFVDALLTRIEALYCVDETRVYASGVSNGGNMVNYVACRDASLFAAVAPVVGPMYGQDDGPCRPSRPVPIIDIHSVNDPDVPYGGHPGPPYYDFPLASVSAWLQGWAGLDGCRSAPSTVTEPGNVQRETWNACAQGARIVAYATWAGHSWPATLDGEPAAVTVWSFLSSFRLPS